MPEHNSPVVVEVRNQKTGQAVPIVCGGHGGSDFKLGWAHTAVDYGEIVVSILLVLETAAMVFRATNDHLTTPLAALSALVACIIAVFIVCGSMVILGGQGGFYNDWLAWFPRPWPEVAFVMLLATVGLAVWAWAGPWWLILVASLVILPAADVIDVRWDDVRWD